MRLLLAGAMIGTLSVGCAANLAKGPDPFTVINDTFKTALPRFEKCMVLIEQAQRSKEGDSLVLEFGVRGDGSIVGPEVVRSNITSPETLACLKAVATTVKLSPWRSWYPDAFTLPMSFLRASVPSETVDSVLEQVRTTLTARQSEIVRCLAADDSHQAAPESAAALTPQLKLSVKADGSVSETVIEGPPEGSAARACLVAALANLSVQPWGTEGVVRVVVPLVYVQTATSRESLALVMRTVQGEFAALGRCFSSNLTRSGASEITVDLTFSIDVQGKVTEIALGRGTATRVPLQTCIKQNLGRLTFSPWTERATTTVTLSLFWNWTLLRVDPETPSRQRSPSNASL